MATIWIVEDEERIGLLILAAVKKAGHEAVRLYDASELEKRLKKETPDLLLLDLMLRGKDGFCHPRRVEGTQGNRPRAGDHPFRPAARENDKVRGLELGAEDYITKPFGVRELQARLQTALRRVTPEAQKWISGDLTLQPDAREAWQNGARVALTYREFELLYYLARRPGQAVSRGQLLRDVWGYPTEDDPSRTVDYHIKSLRAKLGDDPANPRYIETLRGTDTGGSPPKPMRRKLLRLYCWAWPSRWRWGLFTVGTMVYFAISDTEKTLLSILSTASAWTKVLRKTFPISRGKSRRARRPCA